jgi:Predicted Zn-dependent protease (DUF2268)
VKIYIFEKYKNYSMKKLLLFATCIIFQNTYSQSSKVFTEDIDRFWVAYDSVIKIKDIQKQTEVLQKMYIDKGTIGLKAFMEERQFKASDLVEQINAFPKFWNTVRPRTLLVKTKIHEMQQSIDNLKKQYPDLKESAMYFTIGALKSGGTVQANKVLIGSEIALGDQSVDVTEFSDNWLRDIFAFADDDRLVALNVHEYIHTQQNVDERKANLLGNVIAEGACDFVAELITKKPYKANYLDYYPKHELEIWSVFNNQMYGLAKSDWLGTGGNPNLPCSDLGYAVGYSICKHFYENAKNKPLALKQIIEGQWDDATFSSTFLDNSGYLDYLKKRGFEPSKAENIEGYKLENDRIKFVFKSQPNIVAFGNNGMVIYKASDFENIKNVNIAGDFNGWNKESEAYKMKRISTDVFELELPITEILKKGERKYFKFVINGQNWVEPQFKTTNKGSADGGSTNLFVIN